MFWILLIVAGLALYGFSAPWWAWGIWGFLVLVKFQSRDTETDKQADYIDDLCADKGISRKEAAREALGESKRDFTKREASKVIDWLLEA